MKIFTRTIPQKTIDNLHVNMKATLFTLLFCCQFLLQHTLSSEDIYAPLPVYSQIKDIYHPTTIDYRNIQNYLTYGERSLIKRLKDYESNARNFKIIGDTREESPQANIVAVNCSKDEKENCLILYSSFNKNYPRGLKRLVSHAVASDFKGHILYRLGGWPNVEEGDITLAHVPYAFKVCMFREAKRLGYKRAFWLDTAVLPLVSLNQLFQMLEEKGYFVVANSHLIGPYMDPSAADAFGLSMEVADQIPSCAAGIIGIDFTNKAGMEIVEHWYHAAENKVAFFSPRSDQNALSIILYQMGITDFVSIDRVVHNRYTIKANSLFLIDREYVNQLSGISK